MKKNDKEITFNMSLDVIILTIALIIPMIGYLHMKLRGLLIPWVIFSFFIIFYGLIKKRYDIKKTFRAELVFLMLFAFITLIYYNFIDTNPNSRNYAFSFHHYIFIYLISTLISQNPAKQNTIIYLIYLIFGALAIVSIPYILTSNPMTIRYLSSGQLEQGELVEAYKHGLGPANLYASLSLYTLYGISFQSNIKNKILRILLWVALLFIVISIFLSTFLAPIAVLASGLFLLIIFNLNKEQIFKTILAISILVIIGYMVKDVFLELDLVRPVVKKVEMFFNTQSDPTGRDKLFMVSYNTFAENPFFGIGVKPLQSYHIIGEHMPWIDLLANFGIISLMPLLLFFTFRLTRRFYDFNKRSKNDVAALIGVITYFIANFFNPLVIYDFSTFLFIFVFTSGKNNIRFNFKKSEQNKYILSQ